MVKYLSANSGAARDASSIPRLGRSPGGGDGNPLQYSCLGNLIDQGDWRATVHGIVKYEVFQLRTSVKCSPALSRSSQQSVPMATFKGNDILAFYIQFTEDVCAYTVSAGSL